MFGYGHFVISGYKLYLANIMNIFKVIETTNIS